MREKLYNPPYIMATITFVVWWGCFIVAADEFINFTQTGSYWDLSFSFYWMVLWYINGANLYTFDRNATLFSEIEILLDELENTTDLHEAIKTSRIIESKLSILVPRK